MSTSLHILILSIFLKFKMLPQKFYYLASHFHKMLFILTIWRPYQTCCRWFPMPFFPLPDKVSQCDAADTRWWFKSYHKQIFKTNPGRTTKRVFAFDLFNLIFTFSASLFRGKVQKMSATGSLVSLALHC